MRTQSEDTSPEMERVQIELIRKAPITKRFALMQSWTQFIIEVAKQGIRRTHPSASEEEVALILYCFTLRMICYCAVQCSNRLRSHTLSYLFLRETVLVAREYGQSLADKVRADLERRRQQRALVDTGFKE